MSRARRLMPLGAGQPGDILGLNPECWRRTEGVVETIVPLMLPNPWSRM
jgi:hypothetical protein